MKRLMVSRSWSLALSRAAPLPLEHERRTDMEKLYELKDRLCEELEEIGRKPDMGPGDLELIHKLTDTIKNMAADTQSAAPK